MLIKQLLSVWESAVMATHLFLSKDDIEKIKAYVPEALVKIPHLIIIENNHHIPVGFMGIANQYLEMLFVSNEERGKGLGNHIIIYDM